MKVYKTITIEVPNLGPKIQEARSKSTLPLEQICRQINMSRTNWYRIEKEEQSLPIETLRKIEEILEVDFGVSFDD